LEQAVYAPVTARFKVYMIDEVHMLTKEAFNAMLKTLEEPPDHVKFILATTDPQKVPVTILSRCLQFNLRQMASTTIAEYLQNVLSEEGIPCETSAIQLLSRAAAGSMRDALSLTDQAIAYGKQTINEAEVRSMLGAIDQGYLFEIIQALIAHDGPALIEKAKQMEARSISFEAALNDLANVLHQIAIVQTIPASIAADVPERSLLFDLAKKLPAETVQLYYQIALLGRRDIGLAPDEYAGFTMSLLRMLAFLPAEKSSNEPMGSQPASEKITKVETSSPKPLPVAEAISTANNLKQFNGNWRNLVEQNLKLGLARALAHNCELVSHDENSMTLRVAKSQKHLISASYQDKLSTAINDHFGRKIQLNFEVAATGNEANTPAKQNAIEKAAMQSNVETAIMNDQFVQALIHDFDAQIIPNTIKPVA
ncbi:MAG: DNA polymerase III subunit gamma/tau C-terminal domain-containing protein, partial [Methylophilaceae bacterium]